MYHRKQEQEEKEKHEGEEEEEEQDDCRNFVRVCLTFSGKDARSMNSENKPRQLSVVFIHFSSVRPLPNRDCSAYLCVTKTIRIVLK